MSFLSEHYNEIFKKFSETELINDINSFRYKKGRLTKLLNHYFKECIYNSKGIRGSKTPMQALSNEKDVEWIIEYTKSKPKFYTGSTVSNVESFFRNGGRLATKVANFDPKNAREIYSRYANGGKKTILDTSSGFGTRMIVSLLCGHNYYGIDPNKELVKKLNECATFLKDNQQISNDQKYKIFCQGSETFIPELVNTCDIMFTSPPYFNLESYSSDNCESTKNYNNYSLWLEKFVEPTIKNIHQYLKVGGVAMINIKNLTTGGKQPLFNDWKERFENHGGFEFVEIFEINHQSKKNYTQKTNYSVEQYKGFKEPIMVFRKVR